MYKEIYSECYQDLVEELGREPSYQEVDDSVEAKLDAIRSSYEQ